MLKFFLRDPYQDIIDFIDAAVDTAEISSWLAMLEHEPENMRMIRLAEIRIRMKACRAPKAHMKFMSLLRDIKILRAMNDVIKELSLPGRKNRKNNPKYNSLINLLATPTASPPFTE